MYYYFQVQTYGEPLDPTRPADLMRDRPMPCTPPGDWVAVVERPADHPELLGELGICRLTEALARLSGREGIEVREDVLDHCPARLH